MVETLARKLKLPGESCDPSHVLDALQAEIDRDYETEQKQSAEVEEKLKTLEDQYSDLTKQKATAEANLEHNEDLVSEKQEEISNLRSKIDNLSQTAARLNEVRTEEKQLSRNIEDFDANSKIADLDQNTAKFKTDLSKFNTGRGNTWDKFTCLILYDKIFFILPVFYCTLSYPDN